MLGVRIERYDVATKPVNTDRPSLTTKVAPSDSGRRKRTLPYSLSTVEVCKIIVIDPHRYDEVMGLVLDLIKQVAVTTEFDEFRSRGTGA